MAEKRRLPVLKQDAPGPEDDDAVERPPWQWVGFGVVLVFAAWLPLAWLAEAVKRRLLAGLIGGVASAEGAEAAIRELPLQGRISVVVATLGLPALAMAAGAALGGYVVGRFGPKTTAREPALAGAASGIVAAVLAWTGAGFSLAVLVAVPILAGAAYLGGRRGVRRKTG